MGNHPHLRGEFPPVLRQQRQRRGDGAGPQRPLRRAGRRELAQMGALRAPLRPGPGAERDQPPRLRRRDRPVRPELDAAQAHGAGALQARGGEHDALGRQPRGRLLGRRPALRLHVQVRQPEHVQSVQPGGEPEAARRGHALRGEARRLGLGRVDPAGPHGSALRLEPGRHLRVHAAGGRPRGRDADGSPRGHRGEPGQPAWR